VRALCCSAIQYGYVCFFSVVFPFAPLCALLNNLLLVRLCAYKLCRLTKRPLARQSSGLGIWLQVLQLMSIGAVLTNCALIAVSSSRLSAWFPSMSASTKTLLVFAFEHGVIALKVAVALLIPDVTAEVQMHRRKQKRNMVQAQTQVMERRRMELSVKRTGAMIPASELRSDELMLFSLCLFVTV